MPSAFIHYIVLLGPRVVNFLSFNLPVDLSRIKADPGAGLQCNSLSCLSQCWVSALTAALILSQKPQELFSKSCRKTSCFSPEAVQCFFTKDIHFEFWKVTKLVPNCTVRPKTFQSSQCFNVAFLAAAKKMSLVDAEESCSCLLLYHWPAGNSGWVICLLCLFSYWPCLCSPGRD